MRAVRDAAFIYCGVAAALLAVSMLYFAWGYAQNAGYKQAKAALASTDLSEIAIDGLKPGMAMGKLSPDAFAFDEDGVKYNSFGGDEQYGVIADAITGDLFWHKTSVITYKGQPLNTAGAIAYNSDYTLKTANAAITAVLGENYLTYAIKHESQSPSVIYRDQANGLELRLYYYGAELSKAVEPLDLPGYKRGGQGSGFPYALIFPLLQ